MISIRVSFFTLFWTWNTAVSVDMIYKQYKWCKWTYKYFGAFYLSACCRDHKGAKMRCLHKNYLFYRTCLCEMCMVGPRKLKGEICPSCNFTLTQGELFYLPTKNYYCLPVLLFWFGTYLLHKVKNCDWFGSFQLIWFPDLNQNFPGRHFKTIVGKPNLWILKTLQLAVNLNLYLLSYSEGERGRKK